MKRQTVRDAYKRIQPSQQDKERMLETILSAASDHTAVRKDVTMKRRKMKPVMIAAMIGLMIFLMGCAVVLFTLQDMKIGEYNYTEPRYIDENGEKVYKTEKTRDVISLQGIVGSPEQMAAQEWYEFEQGYDADNTLLFASDENGFDAPAAYDAYFVYTQEMIDKVDEIAEKYDLQLAGAFAGAEEFQMDIFFDALGIENLHQEDAQAEVEYADAYFYACGNFKAELWLTLTGEEANWEHEILASMRYCGKGYLDTVFAYISDIDDYEQWTYTMKDGNTVLIVMGNSSARIFYDGEASFVSVGFDTTYEDESGNISRMTKRDVELVADAMDFSVIPQKPDMEEAQRRIDESYAKWKSEEEAKIAEYENPFGPKTSYGEKIQFVLDNGVDPDNYYYALYDVNGDGIEDLFLGREKDSFGTIYTMYNGETYMLSSFGIDQYSYLCENGIILHNEPINPDHYSFYKIGEITGDGLEAELIDTVAYDAWDETWIRCLNGQPGNEEPITEEEAMVIIKSYGRVDLDMKPISEYPMD